MIAAPAAPMNWGRFSAAQSRLADSVAADPWNAGITSRANSSYDRSIAGRSAQSCAMIR